ncbi:synaptonemal complex central element protein 3 isoform X2 [Vidua macroura]|uniref:synaptonemal complex central element protein 3 isoform X2 n=1 Tax=Vidua macroura TaxID=187451 RepID=UPI0023A84383|nr:synaptonemal complex central element protein 3 isoform X2 [Vidua macroura]
MMAESESQEGNHYNRGKMVENFKMDMEELLEEMEKLTVRAAWMTYDCVAIQTNPDLYNAMQHLEDVFLMCKEQMEKKWQEVLLESRGTLLSSLETRTAQRSSIKYYATLSSGKAAHPCSIKAPSCIVSITQTKQDPTRLFF